MTDSRVRNRKDLFEVADCDLKEAPLLVVSVGRPHFGGELSP
jgi:hypothetical protein